jgi:hypothetical protein
MTPRETEAFEAARRQWNAEQDRWIAYERELRKRTPFDLSPPRWYNGSWHQPRWLPSIAVAALFAGCYAAFICPVTRSPLVGLALALFIGGAVYCCLEIGRWGTHCKGAPLGPPGSGSAAHGMRCAR